MGLLSWLDERREIREEKREYYEKQWEETGDAESLTELIRLEVDKEKYEYGRRTK